MLSKIAAIQMNSQADVLENLKVAEELISIAARQKAELVVLPEMFAIMGLTDQDKIKYQERLGTGLIQNFLIDLAKREQIWIVAGTIPLSSTTPKKVHAASLVINNKGEIVARYDKVHLFDVQIGEKSYCESATTKPGSQSVVVETPIGKLGIAVCYDIRFPEFFGELVRKGAEVIVVPAAFTVETGKAHWEVLMRARAIENWCYLVGACQVGVHPSGRATYGHSLIIDP